MIAGEQMIFSLANAQSINAGLRIPAGTATTIQ